MLAALLLAAACTPLPTCGAAVPSAPPALVQHVGMDAGMVSSASLAFQGSVVGGNSILVAVRAGTHTGHVLAVSDSRGNAYARVIQYETPNDTVSLVLFHARNVVAGSTTVTVSDLTTPGTMRFAILEYSGLGAPNGQSATAYGNGASYSAPQPSAFSIGVLSTSNVSTVGGAVRESVAGKLYVVETQLSGTISPMQAWAVAAAGFVASTATGSCGTPTPTIIHDQVSDPDLASYSLYVNAPGVAPQLLVTFPCEHYDLDEDGVNETRVCRCADLQCPVQRYCPQSVCPDLTVREFTMKAADSAGNISATYSNTLSICMPPIYPGRPSSYE